MVSYTALDTEQRKHDVGGANVSGTEIYKNLLTWSFLERKLSDVMGDVLNRTFTAKAEVGFTLW